MEAAEVRAELSLRARPVTVGRCLCCLCCTNSGERGLTRGVSQGYNSGFRRQRFRGATCWLGTGERVLLVRAICDGAWWKDLGAHGIQDRHPSLRVATHTTAIHAATAAASPAASPALVLGLRWLSALGSRSRRLTTLG